MTHNELPTPTSVQTSQEPPRIDPLGDNISCLELTRISGSDLDVVNAARVSYGKTTTMLSQRDKALITYLAEHDHTSPFEHNQLSFRVKCPIFVMRQWIRHRMNSYNEISYRYVEAPLEFYIPPAWRYQDTKNRQGSVGSFEDPELLVHYKETLDTISKSYKHLLEQGVARELARGILPLCTYTEFIFTCNLHSLLHFVKLRLHPGAQFEIRRFAEGLLNMAEPHFPMSIKAFRAKWQNQHPH